MGMMCFMYSIPGLTLALVALAVASRRLADAHGARRWSPRSCGVRGVDAGEDRRHDRQRRLDFPGAGRRPPRSGCWPGRDEPKALPPAPPAAGPSRTIPPREPARDPGQRRSAAVPTASQRRRREPTGRVPRAGARRRRSRGGINTDWAASPPPWCGAGRSVRHGRRSPSGAIGSTRRSSAVRTRSSPATT